MGRFCTIKRIITSPATLMPRFIAARATCPLDFNLRIAIVVCRPVKAIFAFGRTESKQPSVHVPRLRSISRVTRRNRLSPTVDAVPPDDFEPLHERGLGPFTATPPVCAKEPRIFGGSHRPVILRQAALKDGASAGRMPVTGDEQYSGGMEWLHAFAHIASLSERGIFFKRTDADLRGHLFGVLPQKRYSIFGGRVAEISGVRGSIKE